MLRRKVIFTQTQLSTGKLLNLMRKRLKRERWPKEREIDDMCSYLRKILHKLVPHSECLLTAAVRMVIHWLQVFTIPQQPAFCITRPHEKVMQNAGCHNWCVHFLHRRVLCNGRSSILLPIYQRPSPLSCNPLTACSRMWLCPERGPPNGFRR